MRRIHLRNRNRYALIDDEDYARVKKHTWTFDDSYRGCTYVRTDVGRKKIFLHRFVLKYDGTLDVDHVNHDGLDNRKSNLRICVHRANCLNQRRRVGAQFVKKNLKRPWRARVQFIGRSIHLGYFENRRAALNARRRWVEVYGPEGG